PEGLRYVVVVQAGAGGEARRDRVDVRLVGASRHVELVFQDRAVAELLRLGELCVGRAERGLVEEARRFVRTRQRICGFRHGGEVDAASLRTAAGTRAAAAGARDEKSAERDCEKGSTENANRLARHLGHSRLLLRMSSLTRFY